MQTAKCKKASELNHQADGGLVFRNHRLPDDLVGQLQDSSPVLDERTLRRRLVASGYVFLRGVLGEDEVLEAREEVFSRLVEVDEIKSPAIEGVATGRSRRRELVDDLVAFWRSVSEGVALRQVSHGPRVRAVMEMLLGEPARPQDYLWLRPRAVGWSTGLHFDHPFFARGSQRVYTVWIPLGDIPLSDGPLMLVNGSNKFLDLVESMHNENDEANNSPAAAERSAFEGEWSTDLAAFLRKRDARVLSAEFRTGDVLVFGMNILHGSLDNRSPIGRTRLSCDVRYQPYSDPLDERYFGLSPSGASGHGYGDMNSCKPLTELS